MEISRRIYRKPFSAPKACLVGDTQSIVYSVHGRSLEETGGNRRNVDCGVNLTCRNQEGKDHILRCERKNIRRRLIYNGVFRRMQKMQKQETLVKKLD
jgi:hypothetical protein